MQLPRIRIRRYHLLVITLVLAIVLMLLSGYDPRPRSACTNSDKLVVRSARQWLLIGTSPQVEVVCADGSGVVAQILIPELANARSFDLSPDGHRIVLSYRTRFGTTILSIVNSDGSGSQQIVEDEQLIDDLDWSPDGEKILLTAAFNKGYGIYIIDLVCLEKDIDCASSVTYLGHGFSPVWSSNGEKIAFTVSDSHSIYSMNADGTNRINLTHSERPDWQLTWSPDDSQIAFFSLRDPVGIYIMNADGTDPVFLTEGSEPKWSRDGEYIAFTSARDSSGQNLWLEGPRVNSVYAIRVDGSETIKLTFHEAEVIGSYVWLNSDN